jgi:hypothetical protein
MIDSFYHSADLRRVVVFDDVPDFAQAERLHGCELLSFSAVRTFYQCYPEHGDIPPYRLGCPPVKFNFL